MNEHPLERYKRWWLGKMCRVCQEKPFKKVVDVKWYGPPSGFYGDIGLVFEDQTETIVPHNKFKPRKSDVEVGL